MEKKRDFSGLPVEQVVHELPEKEWVCPECGGTLHQCGQSVVRRELVYVPAKYTVVERVFADAKKKHGMRYTLYRGLAQVSNWARLKFAAMNPKRLARWKALRSSFSLLPFPFLYFGSRMLFPSIRLLRQAEAPGKSPGAWFALA